MNHKIALFLAGCLPAIAVPRSASGKPPVLLARCRVFGTGTVLETPLAEIPVDLGALAAANGAARPAAPSIAVLDSSDRPVPFQFEPDPGARLRGRLVWRVPGRLGAREVRTFQIAASRQPVLQSPATGGVRLKIGPDQIVVFSRFYEVHHPLHANGGLPQEIDFPNGFKDKTLHWNDRVYDRATHMPYDLRYDPAPTVRVVARGPLRTVIEVHARYVAADGRPAPGGIRARYRFFYLAGRPTVIVEARVNQSRPILWTELHFLEIHHRGVVFPRWLLGSDQEGSFRPPDAAGKPGAGKTFSGAGCGALFGAGAAIGLAVPGRLLVHDGAGGYGTYLHGPWLYHWSGTEWSGRAALFLGPDAGFPEKFRKWARTAAKQPRVRLEIPAVQPLISRALTGCRHNTPGREAISRLLRMLHSGRRLGAVLSGLRSLAATAPEASTAAGVKEQNNELILWNPFLAIRLGPLDGGMGCLGLFDARENLEFIPRRVPAAPLWRITLVDAGAADRPQCVVTPATAGAPPRVQPLPPAAAGTSGCTLEWPAVPLPENGGSLRVRIAVRLEAGSASARWRLWATPRSRRWGIHEITFPILAGLDARQQVNTAEAVAYPHGWGVLLPRPRTRLAYHGTYPSGACVMQFAAYTAGRHTLYFAAEDGRGYVKRLNLDGNPGDIRFSWTQYPEDMDRRGKAYAQPYPVVTGLIRGDWYDAARKYRTWATRQAWCAAGPVAQRTDVPERLKKIAVWIRTPPRPADAQKANADADRFFQLPIANHWYNWHQIPFDNNYPNYFPPKPGFRNAVAAAHRLRPPVLQMPYINGRLWDTDTENFKQVGIHYCTKDARGKPYIEVYGSGQKLAPMCPFTPTWQHKLQSIVWRLIDDYGVDGVYMDQIGAAGPRFCMDPTHGHPLGGGDWWVAGYWKLLSQLRTRLKAAHPGAFLTTESNAEPYIRYFDAYLMCNSTRDHLAPLFAAVYHDYILTFGRYVFPSDLEQPGTYYGKLAQLFAFGAQLGWISTDILAPRRREGAVYLRRLGRVRERALPYLALGEMLRPPKLPEAIPVFESPWRVFRTVRPVRLRAVQVSVWRAPDGSVGIALANARNQRYQFTLPLNAAEYDLPLRGRLTASVITETRVSPASNLPQRSGATWRIPVRISPLGAQVIVLRSHSPE